MSFSDWINQDPGEPDAAPDAAARDASGAGKDEPGWTFAHAARARAQAERQSNRSRRRRTWRTRAVLARRAMNSKERGTGS